ncbi:MAG: acylphosphatase [Polyangia bacterium]
MERLRAVIKGRVQGVGFRDATAREARLLGLRGWVRNRLEGTVEVSAEGPADALRALESFLRQGPRMANVTGIELFWEESPPVPAPPPAGARPANQPAVQNRQASFEIR